MVLDTSAIVAILFAEPEAERFSAAIEAAEVRLVSTANLVEVGLVLLSRKGEAGLIDLQRFLADADVDRIPVDEQQAQLAVAAFRDFGRGRHPAALNFGDCFAYALSKTTAEPLLFKGRDFSQTDVTPVAL